MRTISSDLLSNERNRLYRNMESVFERAGATNPEEYAKSFLILDKYVPYECNDVYDLAITYKGNVFLIRFAFVKNPPKSFANEDEFVEYIEKHTAVLAKDSFAPGIDKFCRTAEEFGAIPSFILVDFQTMQLITPVIGNKTCKDGKLPRNGKIYRWGLVHAENLKPLDLDGMKTEKDNAMTDWEKLVFCINFVCERLKEDKDCRILHVDDRTNAEPHIWFRNASNELCWVKIEYGLDMSELKEPVHVSQKTKDCCPGIGYTARIVFSKEPLRSHHCTGGSWKYSDLAPIK